MKYHFALALLLTAANSQAQQVDVSPPAQPVLEWLQGCRDITSPLEPYATVMDYACVEKATAFCEVGGDDDASRACRVGLSEWYAAEVTRLLKGLSAEALPAGFQRDSLQRRLDRLRNSRMDGCSDDRLSQACAEFTEGASPDEPCPEAKIHEMCVLSERGAAWLEARALGRRP